MNYWYFRFEGKFSKDALVNSGLGVASGLLVPLHTRKDAEARFRACLKENDIELVEIDEAFPVDGNELDPDDPVNTFWIDWYNEVTGKRLVVFDVWNIWEEE